MIFPYLCTQCLHDTRSTKIMYKNILDVKEVLSVETLKCLFFYLSIDHVSK